MACACMPYSCHLQARQVEQVSLEVCHTCQACVKFCTSASASVFFVGSAERSRPTSETSARASPLRCPHHQTFGADACSVVYLSLRQAFFVLFLSASDRVCPSFLLHVV
jgi:hypothetical protein